MSFSSGKRLSPSVASNILTSHVSSLFRGIPGTIMREMLRMLRSIYSLLILRTQNDAPNASHAAQPPVCDHAEARLANAPSSTAMVFAP